MALQGPADQVDIERGSHASASASEMTKGELLNLALQFYDLQQTHIIHEEDPDTKVILLMPLARFLELSVHVTRTLFEQHEGPSDFPCGIFWSGPPCLEQGYNCCGLPRHRQPQECSA